MGRIEEEIQEYTGRWRSLGASYRQNEIANQEIAELLNTTEQGLNRIQADYRQRKIDYDQSLQELNKVLRRLRLAQIQLDETHVVDANGRVITNRQA